ncbi:MAG: NAD-dependent epimerase/dehydratase family protein [Bacteroidales bacterium]|nr:NAD-dependent epimerase/dehydratase family protein [Bacteroidales bacterium]
MKILVTGAKGFVGKNLCASLKNIQEGKDRRFPDLKIDAVYEYDIDSKPDELDAYCQDCDFVFNLAGVNRPQNQEEFMHGNFGFASTLLDTLKKHGNRCPVMLSSSQQASLTGRFGNSEYGRSKKAGEDLFLDYERDFLKASRHSSHDSESHEIADRGSTGSPTVCDDGLRSRVLIYRFPNLFGKWCRPNYNSAVATFCNNIANDLPITVNDPSVELELLYIDDLVDEMIAALQGKEHRCEFDGLTVIPYNFDTNNSQLTTDSQLSTLNSQLGRYCYCPITHHVKLGEIVDLLYRFAEQSQSLLIPEIPEGSFAKKLYSTYLSYLPKEKVAYPLKMNVDDRGSFTELVHLANCGQVSINISKPGITKGQHWHHTKWELFIVVKGHGLIQERKEGTDEVIEFEVSGDNIQVVHMLPGYTHNIINLSDTEDLVTVMYCNEVFNPNKPDTYFDQVQ